MNKTMYALLAAAMMSASAADEKGIANAKTAIGFVNSRLQDRLLEQNAELKPGNLKLDPLFAPVEGPKSLKIAAYVDSLGNPKDASALYREIADLLGRNGIALDHIAGSNNAAASLQPFALGNEDEDARSEIFLLLTYAQKGASGKVDVKTASTILRFDEWSRNAEPFVLAKDIRSRNPLVLLVIECGDDVKPLAVKLGGKVKEALDPALVAGTKALDILTKDSAKDIQAVLAKVDSKTLEVPADALQAIQALVRKEFKAGTQVHGFRPNASLPAFGTMSLSAAFAFATADAYGTYAGEAAILEETIAQINKTLVHNEFKDDGAFNERSARYQATAGLLAEVEGKLAETVAKAEKSMTDVEIASPSFLSFSLAFSVEKLEQLTYNAEQNTVVTKEQDLPMYVTANLHPWKTYASDHGFGFRDLAPHLMAGVKVPFESFEPMLGVGLGIKFKAIGVYAWGGFALQEKATADGGSTSEWEQQYGVAIRIPHRL